MLRVAVPNKGALSESAAAVLAEAGYRKRSDAKDQTPAQMMIQLCDAIGQNERMVVG